MKHTEFPLRLSAGTGPGVLYRSSFHTKLYIVRGHTCLLVKSRVAKLYRFDAAPAPGKSLDAAPATSAPVPILIYNKPNVLKQAKVNVRVRSIVSPDFF
jgi:hypothetical protein